MSTQNPFKSTPHWVFMMIWTTFQPLLGFSLTPPWLPTVHRAQWAVSRGQGGGSWKVIFARVYDIPTPILGYVIQPARGGPEGPGARGLYIKSEGTYVLPRPQQCLGVENGKFQKNLCSAFIIDFGGSLFWDKTELTTRRTSGYPSKLAAGCQKMIFWHFCAEKKTPTWRFGQFLFF